MPSKLFQKRKAEAERRAARFREERADRRRVLVVAEGSKTEPNYISEFIRLENLGRIEPHLTRDNNTAPMKLLDQAKKILSKDKDFDFAFVVSDRDEFPQFDLAVNAALQIKSKPSIKFIYNDPCFEIWLIFHFEAYDAPLNRHEALKRLKTHLPDYAKGNRELARLVHNRTDAAIANSKTALERCKETGTTCPSTLMHELIEALRTP